MPGPSANTGRWPGQTRPVPGGIPSAPAPGLSFSGRLQVSCWPGTLSFSTGRRGQSLPPTALGAPPERGGPGPHGSLWQRGPSPSPGPAPVGLSVTACGGLAHPQAPSRQRRDPGGQLPPPRWDGPPRRPRRAWGQRPRRPPTGVAGAPTPLQEPVSGAGQGAVTRPAGPRVPAPSLAAAPFGRGPCGGRRQRRAAGLGDRPPGVCPCAGSGAGALQGSAVRCRGSTSLLGATATPAAAPPRPPRLLPLSLQLSPPCSAALSLVTPRSLFAWPLACPAPRAQPAAPGAE